jgi:hypothetical protein
MRPDPNAENAMTTDAGSDKPARRDRNRRVIDITCSTHGGARGGLCKTKFEEVERSDGMEGGFIGA